MEKILISDTHNEDSLPHIVDYIACNHPGKTVLSAGDHTNSAMRREFESVYKQFTRLSETNKVVCAPGNHDRGFMGNFLSEESYKHWQDTIGQFTPAIKVADGLSYETLDDGQVIVGVDSTDPTDEVISARGYISRRLAQELKSLLKSMSDRLVTVMLHHHPFSDHFLTALKGSRRLMDAVADCQALVFGHDHHLYMARNKYDVNLICGSHKTTSHIDGNCYGIILIDVVSKTEVRHRIEVFQ